jgi:hypothetical protein
MSALPPIADIAERYWDVRFVPEADLCTAIIPEQVPREPGYGLELYPCLGGLRQSRTIIS